MIWCNGSPRSSGYPSTRQRPAGVEGVGLCQASRPSVPLGTSGNPTTCPARPANHVGPGGPSDAGTEYLPAEIRGFPEKVRDRFDIISWDPRGMGGRTTPVVQCFDSADDEAAFFARATQDGFPVTAKQLAKDAAGRTAFNEACVKRNGELLAHVSTADNARDLDLLRQAVGEETMNYCGTSYRTFLGATYIYMYPDRVRAAVLDGAVAVPA